MQDHTMEMRQLGGGDVICCAANSFKSFERIWECIGSFNKKASNRSIVILKRDVGAKCVL